MTTSVKNNVLGQSEGMIHKDEGLRTCTNDLDLIASAAPTTTNLNNIISTQNASTSALTKVPKTMKELSIKDSKRVELEQIAEVKFKLTET